MATKNPKNIIILGAGSTGEYLAEELSAEHNITLVDKDINKINQIKNKTKMDLLTISGDASDLSIFNETDLKEINFFIACTDDDKLNILTAMYFEKIPGVQTIVVTKDYRYKDYPGKLDVPEVKTFHSGDIVSQKIMNLFETPYSWETDKIADSRILFLKIKIDESSPILDNSIYSLNKEGTNKWKFLAVTEDPSSEKLNFIKPDLPSTRLRKGDIVLAVIVDDHEEEFEAKYFSKEEAELKNIFIVGGTYIASEVAKKLVRRKCNVKLLVSEQTRARELSEELESVQIILGEPTDEQLLADQGVGKDCDYFLALTSDDEINVLSALLSSKLKARNSLVVYSKSEYQNVINSIGAEREINTKFTVAGEVCTYIITTGKMGKKGFHETIVDANTKIFEFRCEEDVNVEEIAENISLAFTIKEGEETQYLTNPKEGMAQKGDLVIAVTLDAKSESSLESKILK
tara:strand:- start:435 stop:1817 length:1383 start_codon:yes stop_codon:yes gene_type:complete